jgi:hypothetical protein
MGKDRNHPLHVRLRKRDHFDDEQVSYILSQFVLTIFLYLGLQVQPALFLSA